MVLVPVGIGESLPRPWNICPISSIFDYFQAWPLLHLLSSQYSEMLPVSGLIAVPCRAMKV
jgi:hypothetical protein